MVKWRKLDLEEFVLLVVASVFLAIVLIAFIGMVTAQPAQAQDATPTWEYAALVYEGDSGFVFTDDLDINSELNATLDSMGDDFNLIRSLNLMGERGWQFVDAQPAGAGVTLYLFERAG